MRQFVVIFILNLLTSIDNAIIIGGIAKRTRNLFVIATVSSIVITVVRTISIMGLVSVAKFPGLRFVVGIVVLWIAFQLATQAKPSQRQREPSFWRIVLLVVVTDFALSIDNILSLAVVSQQMLVVATAVFVSLLPLLLLLPVIVDVMARVAWFPILVAGFLAELAVDSMTDDRWLSGLVMSGRFEILLRVLSAVVMILYGFWRYYAAGQEISGGQ